MIVAQISDLHVTRKGRLLGHMVNTAKYLRRCVARLNSLKPRPDVVVATGDLVDAGKPKEYKRLRKILEELRVPLYVVPGNHDRSDAFREAFADHRYLPADGPAAQYVIDSYDLRLIGLDTTRPGEVGGGLDERRLSWLDEELGRAPSRPTLIFMHHPPFKTGIRQLDAAGFRGGEQFGAIVERHGQIERIVCGHIHRAMQVRWRGRFVCTAPSTAYQFALELRERRPLGFVLEPPGFLLHVWEDGAMITHECTVGTYDGPRPLP
ncbi:MAG: phosphodiesterase [Candidatus Baltobacteraceae bacterium]|jgi:3',5'-cyclic AMP phosphodiesterase CpdA